MKVSVYLPDELGKRAKAAKVAFSQLLQRAVERELTRRETMAKSPIASEEHMLDLTDEDGPYMGRVTGELLGERKGLAVYLTDDLRVILYWPDMPSYDERFAKEVDEDDVKIWFSDDPELAIPAMRKLGIPPVRDI